MSGLPSPLKSAATIALGLVPTVNVAGVVAVKVPEPVPNKTLTEEVAALVP